jgi:hypothetical protein
VRERASEENVRAKNFPKHDALKLFLATQHYFHFHPVASCEWKFVEKFKAVEFPHTIIIVVVITK